MKKNLKVAIVADWIIGGGAEQVVLALHKIYPNAPIYTSYCSKDWQKRLDNKVITGILQYWPLSTLRKFIPLLRVLWFRKLKLKQYDLVISSSGAEAKFVRPSSVHLSYIHAPTHYYWSRYESYLKNPGFGKLNFLSRISLRILVRPLRHLDYRASQVPDLLIANSYYTKNQVDKYYNRDSAVIHPPVDIKFFSEAKHFANRRGFIVVGRQTHYKRIDLAVIACTRLKLPLTVVGNGPENSKLKKMAGPSVEFIENIDRKQLSDLIAKKEAFIFPGSDDFGIAPVEALAAGTPVIAFKNGGALDYVKPGINGEFFNEPTVASLSQILVKFKNDNYSVDEIKQSVKDFDQYVFAHKITKLVDSLAL